MLEPLRTVSQTCSFFASALADYMCELMKVMHAGHIPQFSVVLHAMSNQKQGLKHTHKTQML